MKPLITSILALFIYTNGFAQCDAVGVGKTEKCGKGGIRIYYLEATSYNGYVSIIGLEGQRGMDYEALSYRNGDDVRDLFERFYELEPGRYHVTIAQQENCTLEKDVTVPDGLDIPRFSVTTESALHHGCRGSLTVTFEHPECVGGWGTYIKRASDNAVVASATAQSISGSVHDKVTFSLPAGGYYVTVETYFSNDFIAQNVLNTSGVSSLSYYHVIHEPPCEISLSVQNVIQPSAGNCLGSFDVLYESPDCTISTPVIHVTRTPVKTLSSSNSKQSQLSVQEVEYIHPTAINNVTHIAHFENLTPGKYLISTVTDEKSCEKTTELTIHPYASWKMVINASATDGTSGCSSASISGKFSTGSQVTSGDQPCIGGVVIQLFKGNGHAGSQKAETQQLIKTISYSEDQLQHFINTFLFENLESGNYTIRAYLIGNTTPNPYGNSDTPTSGYVIAEDEKTITVSSCIKNPTVNLQVKGRSVAFETDNVCGTVFYRYTDDAHQLEDARTYELAFGASKESFFVTGNSLFPKKRFIMEVWYVCDGTESNHVPLKFTANLKVE